jgi:hypothetical protein
MARNEIIVDLDDSPSGVAALRKCLPHGHHQGLQADRPANGLVA